MITLRCKQACICVFRKGRGGGSTLKRAFYRRAPSQNLASGLLKPGTDFPVLTGLLLERGSLWPAEAFSPDMIPQALAGPSQTDFEINTIDLNEPQDMEEALR